MMLCECGGNAHVLQTRRQEKWVRRRCQCLVCKERWSTIEQRAGKPDRNGSIVPPMSQADSGRVLALLRGAIDLITSKDGP